MVQSKKGQMGLSDASAQGTLGAASLSRAVKQSASEFGNVVWPTVGERVLRRVPGGLDGVELGRIGGELLQMQARIAIADFRESLGTMDRGPVAGHDDVTAQMLEQIPEEVLNFVSRDVLRAQPETQTEPVPLRNVSMTVRHLCSRV